MYFAKFSAVDVQAMLVEKKKEQNPGMPRILMISFFLGLETVSVEVQVTRCS